MFILAWSTPLDQTLTMSLMFLKRKASSDSLKKTILHKFHCKKFSGRNWAMIPKLSCLTWSLATVWWSILSMFWPSLISTFPEKMSWEAYQEDAQLVSHLWSTLHNEFVLCLLAGEFPKKNLVFFYCVIEDYLHSLHFASFCNFFFLPRSPHVPYQVLTTKISYLLHPLYQQHVPIHTSCW